MTPLQGAPPTPGQPPSQALQRPPGAPGQLQAPPGQTPTGFAPPNQRPGVVGTPVAPPAAQPGQAAPRPGAPPPVPATQATPAQSPPVVPPPAQAVSPPAAPPTTMGAPGAPRPGVAPGQASPAQPFPPPGQPQRSGMSRGGAAALGLAAGVGAVGAIMAVEGAQRFDDVRERRREQREGDVTIIREPGRTIIRDDDRVFIRRDENERFRDLGGDLRTERRGGEMVTVFERPNGDRVVTVTDENGRLIRRSRRMRDGREIIIIDNALASHRPQTYGDYIVDLPPPELRIPRERYIIDARDADEADIYEALTAPPLEPINARYTLDQVRYSPNLRARMRSVDVDTINFDSGSWAIGPEQANRLSMIAQALKKAIQANPGEVFLIEGHTDAVGPDMDNLSLSDRRAQAAAEALTQNFNVPPENLTTQGYGEQNLKVATQDPVRENRRVTVRRITPLLAGQAAPQ
ncbi:MAG: OmpA family protein [Beijerinckiaceae bacterium]